MDNRSNGSGKQKKDQESTSWTKDPSLAGLDPAKLAMLNSFAQQAREKILRNFFPFLWQQPPRAGQRVPAFPGKRWTLSSRS